MFVCFCLGFVMFFWSDLVLCICLIDLLMLLQYVIWISFSLYGFYAYILCMYNFFCLISSKYFFFCCCCSFFFSAFTFSCKFLFFQCSGLWACILGGENTAAGCVVVSLVSLLVFLVKKVFPCFFLTLFFLHVFWI